MSISEQPATRPPRVADVGELIDVARLLSEEERAIQGVVRKFLDDNVRPHIAAWFDAGAFPRELVGELGKLGVLGMALEGYGCAGVNPTSYGLACLELEAADSALRSFVSVQGSLSMHSILSYGSDEQKDEWLPQLQRGDAVGCFALTEPDFGSDPSGMRTSAKRSGSDWELSGTKLWITNGTIADVATVWARTNEGIQGFLVPMSTRGISCSEVHNKLSLRASATAEIVFDQVRVPDAFRLPGAIGLRSALECLNEARFGIVFGAMGAARDCLQTTRDYALGRVQFDKPLAGFQITQQKLADMSLELAKGLLLAIHLGRSKEVGQISAHAISAGKLNNVREAIEIARTCRTILGAAGITLDFPAMRHANNLESVLTYEGTSEVHTLIIGEALTGIAAYR